MSGDAIVARARELVGAPFRPQGRDRATGLDCIGVVAVAAGIALDEVADDYRLRGGDPARLHAGLAGGGFRQLPAGTRDPGDVLVVRSGSEQLHLIVLTNGGFVQAHAGLRRVVETPAPPPWPVLSAWRYAG